jgi:cell division protein FtsX
MLAAMPVPPSGLGGRTVNLRPVVQALDALRRHPAPALLVVAVLAASLTLLGVWALAREQVELLERWYLDGVPADQGGGVEQAMSAQLVSLIHWGRSALTAFVLGGILALLVAVQVTTGVATMTRRADVRAMRAEGASRSEIRVSLLAQAATLGVAGALVAFAMLGIGTWLLMREPSRQAVFASLPMVGAGELWSLLPYLVVVGVAACGTGGLLAQRTLLPR